MSFRRASFVTVLVVAWAVAASAEPIRITSVRSTVGLALIQNELFGEIDVVHIGQTTSAAGGFSVDETARAAGVGSASSRAAQNTTIDVDGARWFGSGTASHELFQEQAFEVQAVAESMMDIRFTLLSTTPYHLSGTISAFGEGSVQAFLETDGGGRLWNDFVGSGTADLSRSGVLSPGSYVFFLWAHSGPIPPMFALGSHSASFTDLDFRLGTEAPIPEPGSLTLLTTGILAAGIRRFRNRRQRSLAPLRTR